MKLSEQAKIAPKLSQLVERPNQVLPFSFSLVNLLRLAAGKCGGRLASKAGKCGESLGSKPGNAEEA